MSETSLARFGPALSILAILGSTAAAAQKSAAPRPPDVIVEGRISEAQKRVCKQTTVTGSILPVRTCKTKAEWEQIRERSMAQKEQLFRDREQERFTRLCKDYCGQD